MVRHPVPYSVAALLAVLALSAVPAAGASATTTTTLHLERGGSALAEFTNSDGCLTGSLFVFANSSTTSTGSRPTTTEYLQVVHVIEDTCLATSSVAVGFTDTFDLDRRHARSAHIGGTLELTDFETHETVDVVTVDLDLVATGKPEHGHGSFVQRYPGGQLVYRGVGWFAEATATGTVTTTNGDDLAVGTGLSTLDWSSSGQLLLTKP